MTAPHTTTAETPLPVTLRRYALGSVLVTTLTWIIADIRYHLGLRYNPLTEDPFGDLTEYLRTFPYLHTARFFHPQPASAVAYPPVGVTLYAFCYAFPHPVLFYIAFAILWVAGCSWYVARAMMRRGLSARNAALVVVGVLAGAFPIVGLIERGNIELFLWIFITLGIAAFVTGRDDLAAIFWGLAGATKLYPVALFALFLAKKNWRAFTVGVASFIGFSLLAMAWIGPSISYAFQGSLHNIFGYQGVRSSQWNMHEIAANHSLYAYSKLAALISGHTTDTFTRGYYALGALLFLALFFGRIVRLPALNQLLTVMLFMTLLPPVAYYYSLVNLYAPFALLLLLALDAQRQRRTVPHLNFTILLFLLVFASFVLFTYPKVYIYGGLFQGFVLVVLFLRCASYPLELPSAPEPSLP